jgi:hypothetical protein
MNRKVTNIDLKKFKTLCLRCLNENPDIARKLDTLYKLVQVYFFNEATDPNVENNLRDILADSSIPYSPTPIPATTYSRKNVGCILIFLKHYVDFRQRRTDIKDSESYLKNGLFEEFCHLVEQEGDSSIHPESYWTLWSLYRRSSMLTHGNQIIHQLDTDRNHYTVYLMVLRAYPDDWIKRYSKYFIQTPEQYEQQYEKQKENTPAKIVQARLVTDYLRTANVLYVAEKAKGEKSSPESKELLNNLMENGKKDIEKKTMLITKDMGAISLSLIESIDESVFKTPKIFFSVVLDLWKNLKLV